MTKIQDSAASSPRPLGTHLARVESYETDESKKVSCPDTQTDKWLGILHEATNRLDDHSPFLICRRDSAVPPMDGEKRLNTDGYDRDDPKDAIVKYEQSHPTSFWQRLSNGISDTVFNVATAFVPSLMRVATEAYKPKIDQKVVLDLVRQAVDNFPELKIRMKASAYEEMDPKDKLSWNQNLSVIRKAQHDWLISRLSQVYPGLINNDPPTILYTGGRATGLLRVLYCSLDEYLALYWSEWGLDSTDSGCYPRTHVYDYVLEGHNVNWNAQNFDEGDPDFEITAPGEYTFLGAGDRKIWTFKGPCAMLDHGIGDIKSMLNFAILNNITVTLNGKQTWRLLISQGGAVLGEYFRRIKEMFGVATAQAPSVSHVSPEELAQAKDYFKPIMERFKETESMETI